MFLDVPMRSTFFHYSNRYFFFNIPTFFQHFFFSVFIPFFFKSFTTHRKKIRTLMGTNCKNLGRNWFSTFTYSTEREYFSIFPDKSQVISATMNEKKTFNGISAEHRNFCLREGKCGDSYNETHNTRKCLLRECNIEQTLLVNKNARTRGINIANQIRTLGIATIFHGKCSFFFRLTFFFISICVSLRCYGAA